jgi:hypothetical protein
VKAVSALYGQVGIAAVCAALSFLRGSFYRRQRSLEHPRPRRRSPRALSVPERQEALDLMHRPEYIDEAAHEI